MCMGGGSAKSSEEFYQEIKPKFGDLPSLRMKKKVERSGPQYKKVEPRKGGQSRSLLNPYGGSSNADG